MEPLNEEEILVWDVIQEYLFKNRYFNFKKVIPIIISRFAKSSINININGIKKIIKSFVKKNLIIERSKLTSNDLLLNKNRNIIYDFVLKNPGVHFNKIVKDLEMGNFVVEWHLKMLMQFNFIKKEKIGNYDAYFKIGIKEENREIIHIISRFKYKQIIDYLKSSNEGSTKHHISTETGIHINTITKYIKKLEDFGFVKKKKYSKNDLYFLDYKFYTKFMIQSIEKQEKQ